MRAWASAAGVQAPSRSGTIPSRVQRRSVSGDTSSMRATSLSGGCDIDPENKAAEPWFRRCCGQCGPLPRPAAFVKGDALREPQGATHFPAYCLGQ